MYIIFINMNYFWFLLSIIKIKHINLRKYINFYLIKFFVTKLSKSRKYNLFG